jgi:HEAT repeat protein
MAFFGLFGPPNVQRLSDEQDVSGLIEALRYPKDPSVRAEAAEALCRSGDERVIAPLVAALKDGAAAVRSNAAKALTSLEVAWADSDAGRSAVSGLAEVLGDHSHLGLRLNTTEAYASQDAAIAARRAAAVILGKIKDARAIDALIEVLRDRRNATERSLAAEALGDTNDSRAIAVLLVALVDHELFVRKAAMRALPKLDVYWPMSDAAKAAVPIFTAALSESERLSDSDVEQRARMEAAKEVLKLVGATTRGL